MDFITIHINGRSARVPSYATRAEVQHLIDILRRGWTLKASL